MANDTHKHFVANLPPDEPPLATIRYYTPARWSQNGL